MNLPKHITEFSADLFGENFIWGVSTAAYQIEGAFDQGGKGQSIWDVFTAKKGKVKKNQHARVSTDFYHRYQQDIDLIKKLNIPNFRFSISWSRIMPTGELPANQGGIDFYNRVIDYCLESGVEPWITIYHWDLPHHLELQGGWTNRKIIQWFEEYVRLCADSFGDRVKNWMVMNEPVVFTGAGYFLGLHAPGKRGLSNFLPAVLHATLSIAAGGRLLKSILPDAQVGTTFSCSHIEPYTQKAKDIAAAKRVDALLNRLVLEPILGLGFPTKDLPAIRNIKQYMQPGDEEALKFDFDFIGLQNYTRDVVQHSYFRPYIWANLVSAAKRKMPQTVMKWEVYPEAIHQVLKRYSSYPQIKKIYITENGAAFPDYLVNGKIRDIERCTYLQNHINQVLKAKNEGVPVAGYFVWTLTDNFEWAEGYHPRFGLIYVDFKTQERFIKDSGIWYAQFIGGNKPI